MSIKGTVLAAALVAVAAFAGYVAGKRAAEADRIVMSATPQDRQYVALVRHRPCDGGRCETIWLGTTTDDAENILQLGAGERVEEVAWSADGSLVGFVVNGWQLRVYESATAKPRAEVELLKPEGTPTRRIARGITFSANGAAVTYDDCPRTSSGCRSGLAAVR